MILLSDLLLIVSFTVQHNMAFNLVVF